MYSIFTFNLSTKRLYITILDNIIVLKQLESRLEYPQVPPPFEFKPEPKKNLVHPILILTFRYGTDYKVQIPLPTLLGEIFELETDPNFYLDNH